MKVGKQRANISLRVFHLVVFSSFALSTAIGCSPQGELKRTLHPPHKKYLDRLAPVTASSLNAALNDDLQQLTKGLPHSCKIDKGTALTLECQSEKWLVQRSYTFSGSIDPKTECQHSNEIIKCLKKDPPFALYLDWHSSHEKFLRENFLTWKESVHQIWDEKISDDARKESESILASLDWLTIKLSSESLKDSHDAEKLINILGLDAGQAKKSQDFLSDMQSSRLSGKLTLKLLLDRMDEFYEETHGPSPLWEDLHTMSLEGLDE
jgi:hypothetical protein